MTQKIENERQYGITKSWCETFQRRIDEFDAGFAEFGYNASDPIVRKAIRDGMVAMRDELMAALIEYEERG